MKGAGVYTPYPPLRLLRGCQPASWRELAGFIFMDCAGSVECSPHTQRSGSDELATIGAIQHLDGVQHGHGLAQPGQLRPYLHNAADVARGHSIRAGI